MRGNFSTHLTPYNPSHTPPLKTYLSTLFILSIFPFLPTKLSPKLSSLPSTKIPSYFPPSLPFHPWGMFT